MKRYNFPRISVKMVSGQALHYLTYMLRHSRAIVAFFLLLIFVLMTCTYVSCHHIHPPPLPFDILENYLAQSSFLKSIFGKSIDSGKKR